MTSEGDHDDDRKAKSDAAQRESAFTGNPAYVNAIHNAVEEAQDLRHQHWEHALHDVAENFSVFIIYLSHITLLALVLYFSLCVPSAYLNYYKAKQKCAETAIQSKYLQ